MVTKVIKSHDWAREKKKTLVWFVKYYYMRDINDGSEEDYRRKNYVQSLIRYAERGEPSNIHDITAFAIKNGLCKKYYKNRIDAITATFDTDINQKQLEQFNDLIPKSQYKRIIKNYPLWSCL